MTSNVCPPRSTIPKVYRRAAAVVGLVIIVAVASSTLRADTGTCGGASVTLPFTDVPANNVFFCSIAEAFFSGLTNGTSASTYNPGDPVTREQMAAFVTRTLDQSVKRGAKRAASQQFWTTGTADNLGLTPLAFVPSLLASDGADLWVAGGAGLVARVRASDGRLIETWSGAGNGSTAFAALVAMGKVFLISLSNPGSLFQIDPTQPAGSVTTLTNALGPFPEGIAFDGQNIWVANTSNLPGTGSVSKVSLNPISVVTFTTSFNQPVGILFDGSNIWLTDKGDNTVKKLGSNGAVLLSTGVGSGPIGVAFDGTNMWVPNFNSNTVTVVRTTGGLSGMVLATLSGNGLHNPSQAAFDGERILVTNFNGSSVSLWRASNLTPIGTFSTGTGTSPAGACSDGLNFWVTLQGTNELARF